MKQYLALLRTVLEEGEWQENRTGVRTLSYPGAQMRYDLTQGFPALTVRKLAFKSSVAEMLGFLRGYDSAEQFRELGCKVWDQNANENTQWLANPFRKGEDHLGRIYGVQWRGYESLRAVPEHLRQNLIDRGYKHLTQLGEPSEYIFAHRHLMLKYIDQVGDVIRKIMLTPQDRRIIFHGWNPAELDEMALPPCHLLYQFHPNVTARTISMTLFIRSNDLGLGAPFNVCGAAALLSLIGCLTGYEPKILTIQIGDAHIYENHIEMVEELVKREPLHPPILGINPMVPRCRTPEEAIEWLSKVRPSDFMLRGYGHHEHITAPMAV